MSEFSSMPSARSPGAGSETSVWTRRFLIVAIGLLGLRVLYAALFPLDLAPDESYYWDWGRRPDIGYFSKPPMIGWLMAFVGLIGGGSPFVVRLLPGVVATIGLGFVFLLGRDLYGPRAGFWAALLLLATPANVALNTFFTIDAPLFLFWSASLWLAWRWRRAEAGRASAGWAVALAVALGLGYLTKQIQLVFPVLLGVSLVAAGDGNKRWRDPWLPGIVAGSLLFLVPPLLWNWRHDWITFRHTADELSDTPFQWLRSAKFVGEFLGGQAALGGGVTFVLMMTAAFSVLRRWRTADPRERFLVLFFLPGWVAYAALAVHQRVEQNWAMVFYTAAAVLVGGWTESAGAAAGPRVRWRRAGLVLGGGLAVALMLMPFVMPATRWAGSRSDPTARIRGWRLLADRVEPFRRDLARPDRTFLLAPDDRYVASALAFYLPDHPQTFCWEDPRHPESQYGIWGRPSDRGGWDALVILRNPSHPVRDEVARHFGNWQQVGEIEIRLGRDGAVAARDRRYTVFVGRDFRPVLAEEPPSKGG